MRYTKVLSIASQKLVNLKNKAFDIVDINKPSTIDYAVQLSKVVSKLSPLIGNLIEFSTVDLLNKYDWKDQGV